MAPEKVLEVFERLDSDGSFLLPDQRETEEDVPSWTVNDILRDKLAWIHSSGQFSDEQRSTAQLMAICKTSELGTYVEYCPNCNEVKSVGYRSCNNRNCCKCQFPLQKKWALLRESEVIPNVPYFHLVLTLPHELNPLVAQNPKQLLSILFRTSAGAVIEMCMDSDRLDAKPGIISVLHTWTQDLQPHYHIHMICSAGGLDKNGWFKSLKKLYKDTPAGSAQDDSHDEEAEETEDMLDSFQADDLDIAEDMSENSDTDRQTDASDAAAAVAKKEKSFFLPFPALKKLFRGKFMSELSRLYNRHELKLKGSLDYLNDPYEWATFCQKLRNKEWVGNIARTFEGNGNAIDYLARYTFRTAISNSRIVGYDGSQVSFTVRVNGKPGQKEIRTLEVHEFIRRLLAHILPKGFTRVRFYGYLANGQKNKCLNMIFQQLSGEDFKPSEVKNAKGVDLFDHIFPGKNVGRCPCCGQPLQIYSREPAWQARSKAIRAARAAPDSGN